MWKMLNVLYKQIGALKNSKIVVRSKDGKRLYRYIKYLFKKFSLKFILKVNHHFLVKYLCHYDRPSPCECYKTSFVMMKHKKTAIFY